MIRAKNVASDASLLLQLRYNGETQTITNLSLQCFHPVLQLCSLLLLLLSQSLQCLLQLISLLTERRHSAQQLLHLLCGCLTAAFLLSKQTVSLSFNAYKFLR